MTIFCLGSINADHVYRLVTLPRPGETSSAQSHTVSLGGKGVNQSIAALRAGAQVIHVGAVGTRDHWIEEQLAAHGIAMDWIARSDAGTGHAIVAVDDAGENQIIIHSGANLDQSNAMISGALDLGRTGDILLLQNETSHQREAAQAARARGMEVFYSAAPFALEPLLDVLPHITHLLVNELEAEALERATGQRIDSLPLKAVVVTRGSRGASCVFPGSDTVSVPAFQVTPVDTTGAGDCFAGSLAAALDSGASPAEAMRYAAASAALQVTRPGAAPAMPYRAEVMDFLASQGD